MILDELFQMLNGNSALMKAVEAIYPVRRVSQADVAYPYIIIHQISVVPTYVKGESSPQDEYRVQVNTYDDSLASLQNVMTLVRDALDQITDTVGSTRVSHTYFEDSSVEYDDDVRVYVGMQDFIIRANR